MDQTTADSLGAPMVLAARMAVAIHLEMDLRMLDQKAAISGTDRRVTDDLSLSVVSGPSSVVEHPNN